MARRTYKRAAEDYAPSWGGEFWSRLHSIIGLFVDTFAEGATQAVRVRYTSVTPADALDYMATERGLERGPGEATADFRIRLRQAFEAYRYAGTEKAIIDQLVAAGLPTPVVYEDSDWVWDASTGTDWWRFWVVFPEGSFPASGSDVWGSGAWGSGLYGGPLTADIQELVCRVIRKWKPAHALLINVIVVESGNLWGDGHVWGVDPWGGVATYYGC